MHSEDIILKSRSVFLEWTCFGWNTYFMLFNHGCLCLCKDEYKCHELEQVDLHTKVYSNHLDHTNLTFYVDFGDVLWKLKATSVEKRNEWVRRLSEYIYKLKQLSEFEHQMILDASNNTTAFQARHRKTKQWYVMVLVTSDLTNHDSIDKVCDAFLTNNPFDAPNDTEFIYLENHQLYAYWNYVPPESIV